MLYDTWEGQKLSVLSSRLSRHPLLSCPLCHALAEGSDSNKPATQLVQTAVLLTAEELHQYPVLSFFCSEVCAAIGLCLLWSCKPNLSLRSYSRPSCNSADISGQDMSIHTAAGQKGLQSPCGEIYCYVCTS